jgi:hypothetical protein
MTEAPELLLQWPGAWTRRPGAAVRQAQYAGKEQCMEHIEEWGEQLAEAEGKIAEAHEILATLQVALKDAGRKKDAQAIGEAVDRLARYGRLFQDMLASWADPDA